MSKQPKLAADESAIALVEFALIMPVLVFAGFAEFEWYRFAMATQRAEIIAQSVAQMVAAAKADSSARTPGNGVITDAQIRAFVNAAPFLYPDALSAPQNTLEVDIAMISMPLQTNGTYKPHTNWRTLTTNARPCNDYTIVPDTQPTAPNQLPVDMIGPNAIIAVDVRTTYQPTFGASFVPSINVSRSVFMTPRNVPVVEFNDYGAMARQCAVIMQGAGLPPPSSLPPVTSITP